MSQERFVGLGWGEEIGHLNREGGKCDFCLEGVTLGGPVWDSGTTIYITGYRDCPGIGADVTEFEKWQQVRLIVLSQKLCLLVLSVVATSRILENRGLHSHRSTFTVITLNQKRN